MEHPLVFSLLFSILRGFHFEVDSSVLHCVSLLAKIAHKQSDGFFLTVLLARDKS